MKRVKVIRCFFAFLVAYTQCYMPIANAQSEGVPDFYPPKITNWDLQAVGLEGKIQKIKAIVKDNNNVKQVILRVRIIGNSDYEKIFMVDDEEAALYIAYVPVHMAKAPGIEYFIEAHDDDENIAYKGLPDDPFKLAIVSRSETLAAQSIYQPSLNLGNVEIFHQPPSDSIPSNQPFIVSASVSNTDQINPVVLFYRIKGGSTFQSRKMRTAGRTGIHLVELPASELRPPGLEYYFQLEDNIGNMATRGFKLTPLSLDITKTKTGLVAAQESSNEKGTFKPSSKTWIWVGLGVVGAALALSGGKGSSNGSTNTLDDGSSDSEVTLIIPNP